MLAANGFFNAKHTVNLKGLGVAVEVNDQKELEAIIEKEKDAIIKDRGNLDAVYTALCKKTGASPNAAMLVSDLITQEADACLTVAAGLNFENKIVLAIAIRLEAERFIIGKIADQNFIAGITKDQTQALIGKFKKGFPTEHSSIQTLDRVAIMTPENIHLNSFMYEPIIDMSDEHLKKLYIAVKTLT
ncbi:MAG: hypothetical protein WDN46_03195 [Methylocella sp.]